MRAESASGSDADQWSFERHYALIKGLDDASRLVDLGKSELHRIDGANDFSHGMLHLLSHGFERLVKYTLFMALLARDGAAPDAKYMKDLGHDIGKSLSALLEVVSEVPEYAELPVVIDDLLFMRDDPDLRRFIALLSRFGSYERYFDLDVLIDPVTAESVMDPDAEWKLIESDFFDRIPGSLDALASDPTALGRLMPEVTNGIAAVFDRFHRALARMWFLGALGPESAGNVVSSFAFMNFMKDEDLGKSHGPP